MRYITHSQAHNPLSLSANIVIIFDRMSGQSLKFCAMDWAKKKSSD